MIKLIVSDMDGTLLDRDERLPAEAAQMVQKLREKGILFTVATGRVECMALSYVKALGISIPYIACNGATIMDGETTFLRNPIEISSLRPIVTRAREMGMSVIYTLAGKEYILDETPWVLAQREKFNRYHDLRPILEAEWAALRVDKITIMDEVRDGRIGEIERLCAALEDQYCFTRYTDKSVEVVDHSSTKATAVRRVASLLEISMADVMVLGDHQNDIEMLKEAGLGVAVANATPDAKSMADYVCQNRCFAGVLEAVNRFCLQEEKEIS